MAETKLCNKITMYKMAPHSHAFQATWYLNTNVPEKQRREIDKEIAQLRIDNVVAGILDDFYIDGVPETCGNQTPPKVDGDTFGLFFVILLGPLAVVIVVALILGFSLGKIAL